MEIEQLRLERGDPARRARARRVAPRGRDWSARASGARAVSAAV